MNLQINKQKPAPFAFVYVLLFTVGFIFQGKVHAQPVHSRLQNSFIWSGDNPVKGGHTVFRKVIVTKKQTQAIISVFADVRFILWVNGQEVLRGPCRFSPKGPQYDQLDISGFLQDGKNAISVLVMEHGSNGKMMDHVPGLTAVIALKENNKQRLISTDQTWLWNNQTRYLPARQEWGYTCDRIDARLDDGDWTQATYDDSHWKKTVSVQGTLWGPLTIRQIPLLREWDMPLHVYRGDKLPLTLRAGQFIILELDRMIQGYMGFQLDAKAGDSLRVEVGYTADSNGLTGKMNTTNSYICRTGKQVYRMSESYGFRYVKVTAVNRPMTVLRAYATDRRYPYEEVAAFRSNDTFLNKLWERSLHTLRLNAEDGFMDCALREKAEWMGDGAVVEYPATRVLFGTRQKGMIKCDSG